jgi:polyhydroxyalkanoate synthesis regulator phasin
VSQERHVRAVPFGSAGGEKTAEAEGPGMATMLAGQTYDAMRQIFLDRYYAARYIVLMSDPRRIVRYRNRKLYEARERRFVTLGDLAEAVSKGDRVEVVAADTGQDITAQILSRALVSGRAPVTASTDTLTRLLRAGREAAETVAGAVELVGGTRVAESLRRASRPESLGRTLAPLTRRLEDARQDVEKIVGGLVEKGRLTWEEGTRLREDVGLVFQESLSDIVGSVREIAGRLSPSAQPALAKEIGDLKTRLAQLESLARNAFPAEVPKGAPAPRGAAQTGTRPKNKKQTPNKKRRTA